MPDFIPLVPFLPGARPSDSPHYNLQDLIDELARRRATSAPTPSEPPAEPLPDLPPLPLSPIAPSVPLLPTLSAESALVSHLPYVLAQSSQRGRHSREAQALAADFSQAYGAPLRMRKAKRMARRKRTMRAQTDVFTPIDPRSLPVPTTVPSPDDFNRSIEEEGRRRATDEEVRQRARERGALNVPNRPPPTRAPARGARGVGVGAIFDPFQLATDFGAVIGEEAGNALYGRTAEEQAEADRIERELRRREAEIDKRLDEPLGTIPPYMRPPSTPEGIGAYRAPKPFNSPGVLRPVPQSV